VAHLGGYAVVLHDAPNGTNINDGAGALHPAVLADAVVAHGADAGLAFDGDADRLIAVDALGRVVDGDHLMAICALDRHALGGEGGDDVGVLFGKELRAADPPGGQHAIAAARGGAEHRLCVAGDIDR